MRPACSVEKSARKAEEPDFAAGLFLIGTALRDLNLAHVGLGSGADITPSPSRCPLYPRKRTNSGHVGTSALCQKRTHECSTKSTNDVSAPALLCGPDWRPPLPSERRQSLGSRIVKVEPRPGSHPRSCLLRS